MNLKVGDKVVVIAGSSKGKEGKIIKVLRDENKVIVEGCNIVKKHRKLVEYLKLKLQSMLLMLWLLIQKQRRELESGILWQKKIKK